MDQPHRDRLQKESARLPASSARSVVLTMLPLAFAIFVFGAIYGVLARPLAGPWLTMLSSAIIFSGSCQFAIAGLGAAASPLSVIALAMTLNMRHILLGAVLRPRISGSRWRRAILAWFLLDESFGLATSTEGEAGRTLLVSGLMGYCAWQLGTLVGIAGGSLASFEDVASAAFPVLFIGLGAAMASSKDRWIRAGIAAVATAGIALAAPGLRGIAPVLSAIAVALPGSSGSSRRSAGLDGSSRRDSGLDE